MYQAILTPRVTAVATPADVANFGRFECPQQYVSGSSPATLTLDWSLLETMIGAATDECETIADWAMMYEQIIETYDNFPNSQDQRNHTQWEYAAYYQVAPFFIHRRVDSIDLVRRPVLIPTLASTSSAVTAVSVSNNQVVAQCVNSFVQGNVVMLNNTAEGNISVPSQTPATTPFLNGVPLAVTSANGTSFTARFNFYTTTNQGNVTPLSYTNNSDTGTATLVNNPLLLQYNDMNGVLQTWSTINYTVEFDKICLNVGNCWPLTDRRQDCIQITYWAGNAASDPTTVPDRLKLAVLYAANHRWNVRDRIAVETTSEIHGTLCDLLSSYRSMRIPR